MPKILKQMNWRLVVLGISLLLILATAVFPYIHDGFLKWRILAYLNLAWEMNIAVWWSGNLLFVSGLLAYQISSWDTDSKHAWIALTLLFFFLSIDEIGSIHERVGNLDIGSTAYAIIAIIAASALLYSVWVLWKTKSDKQGLIFLLMGIALMVSAAPNEYMEHHFDWPHYLVGPRDAFEEGLELIGAFVCLTSIARYQAADKLQSFTAGSGEKTKTAKVVLVGFCLHVATSWISAFHIEIGFRGNPAIWYVMAVFVALAFFFLLKAVNATGSSFILYLFTACYFTVVSISSMYFILPNPNRELDQLGLIGNPNVILALQLLLVFMLYFIHTRMFTRKEITLFLGGVFALWLNWYADSQFGIYILAGTFSLVTASLFLSYEKAFKRN